MTDSPRSDHEIHLSVTGDNLGDSEPAPRAYLWQKLWSTRKRRYVVLATVLVVLVAGGIGAYFHNRITMDAPEQAMEAFLEAVQAKDVEEVRSLMTESARSEFNIVDDPAALSSDWDIGEIRGTALITDPDDVRAYISTEIIGPNDTRVSDTLEMHRVDGTWLVAAPFSAVTLPEDTFAHLEVNGELHDQRVNNNSTQTFHFLPGVYEYFSHGMDLLEPKFESVVKVGEESEATEMAEGHYYRSFVEHERESNPHLHAQIGLTDDAQEAAQSSVDDYLDACVTEGGSNTGCPVSISSGELYDVIGDEVIQSHDLSGAEWTIDEYPVVEVVYESPTGSRNMLDFETESAGEAELSIEVITDSGSQTFTLQCDFGIDKLHPVLGNDGRLYIGPLESESGVPAESGDVTDTDCVHIE